MKKLFGAAVIIVILFSIDALVLTKNADAGVTCKTDYLGYTRCTDSDGNSSRIKRDYLGNDEITFGDGRRMTCRTDYLGRYRCN